MAAPSRANIVRPREQIEIRAPLDPPAGNVMAIGRNYTEHAAETARARGVRSSGQPSLPRRRPA